MNVENEMGVIVAFSQACQSAGWEIVLIRSQFPDCVIKNLATGETFKAEFEYHARSFIEHGHNPLECDLIICWENNWRDCPMTIWELSQNEWLNSDVMRLTLTEKENLYLRAENARLALRVETLQRLIPISGDPIAIDQERREQVRGLIKSGAGVSEIIRQIWGVTAGSGFVVASAEFNKILASLV
jgi:hypothetical protein